MKKHFSERDAKRQDDLSDQYDFEVSLAQRLLNAKPEQRRHLYEQIYSEFYERFPQDPPTEEQRTQAQAHLVDLQYQLVRPFVNEKTDFVEFGGGNGLLGLRLASHVRHVTMVEATAAMAKDINFPDNMGLILQDTPPYELSHSSIDVAFSCHFLEHLHPDDAYQHIADVHRLLKPKGCYICVTPHRFYGPHDVSRHFGNEIARGLHLKEYTFTELAKLFRGAGYGSVRALYGIGRPPEERTLSRYRASEAALRSIPWRLRRRLLNALSGSARPPFRPLEQVILIATR